MSFDKSLKQGNIGESIVWNWISKQEWCSFVVDVRLAKKFQDMDIDFIVFSKNKDAKFVEVKTDFLAHLTKNIVYEVKTKGNEGCCEKTQADWLMYYIPENEELILLDVPKLKDFVKSNNLELKTMGDRAEGYLLNISDLEHKQIILQKFEGVA